MQDLINQFISAMQSAGCAPHDPAEIKPTGEDTYFKLSGDRKDKRGGYCFTIESDGFAHGNFISFKTGEKGSWHTGKGVKGLTKEERQANEARIKALQADKQAKIEIRHAEKAVEAQAIWRVSNDASGHEYLQSKGIKPHGARIDENDLIYAGYEDGKILTYQRIKPDGTKLFLEGAKKQGTYYPFTAASEDKAVIIIAEGIATAASIREATGFPVLAAWDAGNLVNVAKEMRKKYPSSRIIIAADNDSKNEKNIGILSAQQAAVKIGGCPVVWPEFPEGSDLTDFNDLAQSMGLVAVKDKILSALADGEGGEGAQHISPYVGVQTLSPDSIQSGHMSPEFDPQEITKRLIWQKPPSKFDDGKKMKNSLHNVLVYLRHSPRYHGIFRYDRFACRTILYKEPFYQPSNEKFKVRQINDNDINYIKASLEQDDLSPTDGTVRAAIEVVAAENFINPPLEYLNRISWDLKPRLGKWLSYYLGSEGDPEYLSAVGTAWLISGVARIFRPGCKVDNMLVLEGEQGSLKSTALSVLANVGRGDDEESYFCDTLSFSDISGGKKMDAIDVLHGKLIVEFAELASLGKREVEDVKSWITRQVDEGRKAYGHFSGKYPRQFILAGTTNESLWLKDQTGNRRFWPVKCGKIDINSLIKDREQLWAEAVHLYKTGMKYWIEKESKVWIKAQLEQEGRLMDDVWTYPVEQTIDGHNFITVKEILDSLGLKVEHHNDAHQARVIKILKRLKYKPSFRNINGKTKRGWEKETPSNFIDAEAEEIVD